MKRVRSKKTKLNKLVKQKRELAEFYSRFRNAIIEVKMYLDGEIHLKDAEKWLNEF